MTLFSLQDRIVVITGALGQLGFEFSKALLAHGARVVLLDRVSDERRIADQLAQLDAEKAMYLACDVARRDDLDSALHSIEQRWGAPYGLINNAALDAPPDAPKEENGPYETYPEASWDKIMEVNVKGVHLCCQVFGKAMAIAGRGSIVNISSIYGLVSPNQDIYAYRRQQGEQFFKPVAYSVSKSALLNLSRYLATYWARQRVRVNTLTLAGVFNDQNEQFLREYCARIPVGRMAQRDEYNGAIVYLMSNASSYMTGANMVVDGGWTAW